MNVTTFAPTTFPTLRRGSTGNDVKVLQERLNQFGFKLAVDGIFGYITEGAVKQFQQDHHLVVDGIVGSMTWNALLS
jgi:peptidoglycan hydrolase-like protein with peptidoglycan-binding domain